MSDNPHQRSPGQRTPAGMAVSDKLHERNLLSQTHDGISFITWCFYMDHILCLILVKPLIVLYWNLTFEILHAIKLEMSTFTCKGLILFKN